MARRKTRKKQNPKEEFEHWKDWLSSENVEPDTDAFETSAKELEQGNITNEFVKSDDNLYVAGNVVWDGFQGEMILVPKEYAYSVDGNIFSNDKIARVKQLVDRARYEGEYVKFDAPVAAVSLVDLGTIAEDQQYFEYGSGRGVALSSGDEDLDKFLKDPEEWGDDNMYSADIFDDAVFQKINEDKWSDKWALMQHIWERWNSWSSDELEVSDIERGFYAVYDSDLDDYNVIGEALDEADKYGGGDIGKLVFQMRDGNHRTFGALAAGEPYVWAIVYSADQDELKNAIFDDEGNLTGFRRGSQKIFPKQKARLELLRKSIR